MRLLAFNSSDAYRVHVALALKPALRILSVNLRKREDSAHEYVARIRRPGVPLLGGDVQLSHRWPSTTWMPHPEPHPDTRRRLGARAIAGTSTPSPATSTHSTTCASCAICKAGAERRAENTWYQHWVNEGLGAVESCYFHGHGAYCFGDALADCCWCRK